jgi:hypothetical protein
LVYLKASLLLTTLLGHGPITILRIIGIGEVVGLIGAKKRKFLGSPNIVPMYNCVFLNVVDGTWTNQDCNTPQCYICSY